MRKVLAISVGVMVMVGSARLNAEGVQGFAVTNYKANIPDIPNLATARGVVFTPSWQSWSQSVTAGVLNYMDYMGIERGDHFTPDSPFPGMSEPVFHYQFVLTAIANVHIPAAGAWTFGVNSDDGFYLSVGGQTVAYDGPRQASDTFGTFNFGAPGDYPLALLYFQEIGWAELELFAAPGAASAFDNTFHLVGDTANGGLSVTRACYALSTFKTGGFCLRNGVFRRVQG